MTSSDFQKSQPQKMPPSQSATQNLINRSHSFNSLVIVPSSQSNYPNRLIANLAQAIVGPERLQSEEFQILGPSTNVVSLIISVKAGQDFIDPEAFSRSSLLNEIIKELKTLISKGLCSIDSIGEPTITKDLNACQIQLNLSPLDLVVQRAITNQPVGRLKELHLQLSYTFKSRLSKKHKNVPPLLLNHLISLITVYPLVLPLKVSFQKVFQRIIHWGLLKQLPLVFNSHWQKKLLDSIPKQDLIAKTLIRFANQSVSNDLKLELKKLTLSTQNILEPHDDSDENISKSISLALFKLHQQVKIPNTKLPFYRVHKSYDSSSLETLDSFPQSTGEKDILSLSDTQDHTMPAWDNESIIIDSSHSEIEESLMNFSESDENIKFLKSPKTQIDKDLVWFSNDDNMELLTD
ncbi:hypothetical protein O181_101464 [Austropuccinia psidii MF-1]|uniref:Uncharacterized protein n=1 Tax=Austropuccinia psidii MF-1 TaxID=1389203 RepID=A0A9Q3JGL3_9BASI|nr:hypothetical protein [Austropuccinia psidii MF-1]